MLLLIQIVIDLWKIFYLVISKKNETPIHNLCIEIYLQFYDMVIVKKCSNHLKIFYMQFCKKSMQ